MPLWTAKSSPLHWEPFSDHPISEKLAAMKAAVDSGADPNELDHPKKNGERRPELSIGRPLHYAIDTRFDHSRRHENLPVVELLLQHGADPRLGGMDFTKSPMDEIKADLESPDSKRLSQENVTFFREALEIMQLCLSDVSLRVSTDHLQQSSKRRKAIDGMRGLAAPWAKSSGIDL